MSDSKFPTWVDALDGLRKIVNNPEEYERETGVKVDWQQNPITPSQSDTPGDQKEQPKTVSLSETRSSLPEPDDPPEAVGVTAHKPPDGPAPKAGKAAKKQAQ